MPIALIAALFFTVALLVVTGYFILGSVPLLVLKHDTPLDSSFVRGFFNIYYRAALFTASATAVSYAIAGKPPFAVGAVGLALLAIFLRRQIIPMMDSLGSQIPLEGMGAIAGFRRVHVTAILINMAQLAAIVWSLTTFSLK